MQLKSLILGLCLGVCSLVHADNMHGHPSAEKALTTKSAAMAACGITVLNDSSYSVHVNGTFDDNTPLDGFNVYPYEAPHFISLYYYDYCHRSMFIRIQSNVYPYAIIYNGVAYVGDTLRIINGLAKTVNVEAVHK